MYLFIFASICTSTLPQFHLKSRMISCVGFASSHSAFGVVSSLSLRCLSVNARRSSRTLSTTCVLSRTGGESREMRFERPQMYQLEHIQKRLEFTTPLMFRTRLDYTFYRQDVILEDRIFNVDRVGLTSLQHHLGIIGVCGKFAFPIIEVQMLNIASFLDDGTVRLRWRVTYLTWLKAMDPRNFKPEERVKKVRWYDGYSIFYVDGEGLVYKLTLQKVMPDDFDEKSRTKKFAEKIGVLPGAATSCVGTPSSSSATTFIIPNVRK